MRHYLSLVSLPLGAASLALLFALSVFAQTATTGTIVGVVTDKNGAAISGAEVDLTDKTTNRVTKVTANENGQYIFSSLLPGNYTLTGAKEGFRKTVVAAVKVELTKSHTINISLEVGEAQQTVESAATAQSELQTGDSSVGNAISGRFLLLLPTFTRQTNELIRHQPLVTPDVAVAGARQDQSTFLLDGIDVTDNSVGGVNAFMRLPVESVDEFRVAAANSNASFGRGAGAQISVIGRRGGANFHGAAYGYHQNDNFNAASWTNKRTLGQDISDPVLRHKIQEPETKDSRYGFSFGGPYPWYENLYFFLNHERRRFPRVSEFSRLVPTDTLRQGILRFRDASGQIVDYKLAEATSCAGGRCDPREVGISPAISSLWSALPAGNDPSLGDGLNTIGFRGAVSNPLNSDYYNARFDYDGSKRWRFDGSFRYFGERNAGTDQLLIIGANHESKENFPTRQNMIKAGVTGQLTDNLIGEIAFGWVRSRASVNRVSPSESAALLGLPIPAIIAENVASFAGNVALDLNQLAEPIDVRLANNEVASSQANDNKNHQLKADFNWLKGSHTVQFGSHVRYLRASHLRTDEEGGILNALVAQIGGGGLQIPDALRPPICNGGVTTNCLQPGDVQQWNLLYATTLGLVDNINALAVRDEHSNLFPFGAPLATNTRLWAPEFYFQDIWRARPSLTLTYGLNYGWQTPPKARLGRATILVGGDPLQPQTALEYFSARDQAARRGEIFNPTIEFQTVNNANRGIYDIDWDNIGPRASVAWNPNFSGGFLGALFGDGKTVIRGGYGVYYDRMNTAQSVILTTTGAGFAQTANLTSPLCNATSAGGLNCNSAGSNVGLSGFRVGVDGTPPLPTVPDQNLFEPIYGQLRPGANTATANPDTDVILFPETLSFQVDPSIEVAENQVFDFTWQRELPGNMIFEAGYVGRYAKKLAQNMSLGQVPFQHLDTASNQTFAQAFDALAAQLRSGTAAASVTKQSWFENQLSGTPICNTPGLPANNCTAGLAAKQLSNIRNGNLNGVFETIDRNRIARGLDPFNNYLARTLILRSSTGRSNYNAAFATLRKRLSAGLLFTANYTFSRSLDQLGLIQSSTDVAPNNFDLDAEYGPSTFDITHQFNVTGGWELPFGNGRHFDLSGALDKMFGGWYSSWIFTWQSGAPLVVVQGPGVWGGGFNPSGVSGAIPITDLNSFGVRAHEGVTVSGDIGSNGNSGSGINIFENPEEVFNSVRPVEISRDGRSGRANPLRGLPRWNLDMSLGKKTMIRENTSLSFNLDFFNVLNHVNFANPSLDLTNRAAFGVITEQFIPLNRSAGSRWVQLGLRLEF